MPEKPLFEYTLTPNTVYISRDPLNPSIAKLTVGVTNATEGDIECDWTSIIIPIGEAAGDLTSVAGSIQTSSSRPNEWNFRAVSGAPGQFMAEPVFPNTGLKAGGSVIFELSNIHVNGVLGSPRIEIIEMTDGRREDSKFLNKSMSDLRIEYFTVTPNSIKPGELATLKWKTQSAARCTLTRAGYQPEPVAVTDSKQVQPDDSANYTLDAYGVGQVQASVHVSVIRVRIASYRGPTVRIPPGGKAALFWRTEFATRCELKENGVTIDSKAPVRSDPTPYWVSPKKDQTEYTLFAYDAESNYDQDDLRVFLQPRFKLSLRETWTEQVPPRVSYIATPKTSPNDTRLFVSSADGQIYVLDTASKKRLFARASAKYYFLEPSPDGKKLFAEEMMGVGVLDAAAGSTYPQLVRRTEVLSTGAAFHPDGSKVYFACGVPRQMKDNESEPAETDSLSAEPVKGLVCADTKDLKTVFTLPLGQVPGATSISPDGKTLCLVDMRIGHLYLIDTASKEVSTISLGEFSGRARIVNSVWSPDGKKIYATNNTPGTIWVVTVATKAVTKIDLGADVSPVILRLGPPAIPDFEEGSNILYALCAPDGTVAGISTATDTVLSRYSLNQLSNPAFAFVLDPERLPGWPIMAIAPDGKSIYVSNPTANSIFVLDNGWHQRVVEEAFPEAAEVEQERTIFDYEVSPRSVYITRDPHNPSVARLDIGVTNNTGSDMECDWISFIIITGQGGGALTADPGSIKPSSSRPNEWAITPIEGVPGQFIAEPVFPNTGLKAGDSISFRLDTIIVNGELGASNFEIAEKVEDIRGKSIGINKIKGDLNIEFFRVQPPDIKPGGSATLSWKTAGAASCILSWPTGSVGVDLTGSKDVEPSDTTIYTLTAKGGLGPDVSEQRAVVVNKVIIVLEAKPIAVGLDGSSVLTWRVMNSDPDTCRLDPGDLPVGPVGEKLVTLSKTTPYTISARGGDQFDFKQVIISVEHPLIRYFRATTPERPGASVTLSWDTQYAKSVMIDQGVGPVPPVGSTVVSNVNQTTYTLTCLGLGEPVKSQVTVPGNKVRITSLTTNCVDTPFACNNLFFGVRFNCVWQTEFATSTRLIRVKDNTVVATQSGEFTYFTWVPANRPEDEYRLVAEGPGGPAERKIMLGWGLVSE